MVKVSTLFYRVDGFDVQDVQTTIPDKLDLDLGDQFLNDLLKPFELDPGEKMVKAILEKI